MRVLVSGHEASAPPGTSHLVRVEALGRPSGEHAERFVRTILEEVGRGAFAREGAGFRALLARVRGLEASTLVRLIRRAAAVGRGDLLGAVREERARMLESGVIEVREVRKDAQLGGLDVLVAHLEDVHHLLDDWRDDDRLLRLLPKGMLLVGPPGCGKSLAAEVAAKVLEVPLLQLHASRLMDKFLGGSEARLEAALATARAAAPCVLWIDELEKAVGGLDGPAAGGTGGRMLGRLLSWMQDNRHGVFVVATANSLDRVPPELLRRGRFDEHFSVGMPGKRGREEILRHELTRHGAPDVEVDEALLERLDGFSGADLAALVLAAARLAQLRDGVSAPSREHVRRALEGFVPQARQWPAEMERMVSALAVHGFRSASSGDGAEPVSSIRRERQRRAELAPALSRLLSDEPLVLDFGAKDGAYLRLTTEDGERVALLGALLDAGGARRRYWVRPGRDGDVVALVLADGEPSRGFPWKLALGLDQEGAVELRHPEHGAVRVTVLSEAAESLALALAGLSW